MLTRFNDNGPDALALYREGFSRKLLEEHAIRLKPGLTQDGIRYMGYYEPDDTLLVSHSRSNRVHLINLGTGKMRFHDAHAQTVRKILVHNGEIISASWDGTVRVLNYHTLRERLTLTDPKMGRSPYVAVSDCGNYLVSISYDSDISPECRTNSVKVWDLQSGRLAGVIGNTGEHRTSVRSGACMVHDKFIYVVSDSSYLSVFEAGTRTLVSRCFLSENLRAMCIHSARNLVLVSDISGNVHFCRPGTAELVQTIKCHREDISSIRVHTGMEDIIITTSFDGTIRFWELPSFSCRAVISCDEYQFWTQAIRKDVFFAGSDEGDVLIYDIHDLDHITLKGKLNIFQDSYALSPVGSDLFFTNDISNYEILNKETGEAVAGKTAEYLLNFHNSESVLQDIFRSTEEQAQTGNASLQWMRQLPPADSMDINY